jgi:endonuclease/exonuclease/phosphatase family metal-dependent hydrolase
MRLMTYNILTGGRDGDDVSRFDGVCEVIRQARPDVLLLQECNGFDDEGARTLYRLERETGLRGVLARASTGFHVGLFLRPRVGGDGEALHLVETRRLDAEVYHAVIAARIEVGGRELGVVGAHLCPFGGHARLAEVGHLIRHLRGGPSFLLGDLNSLSATDAHRYDPHAWLPRRRARHVRVGEGGGLDTRVVASLEECQLVDLFAARSGTGVDFLPTNQTRLFDAEPAYQVRIDYVFADVASAAAVSARARVDGPLADRASDHYALYVDVDLDRLG